MCRRRRADLAARGREPGFTLVEVEIAMLLLVLLVLGFSRLAVGHERLVTAIDAWTEGDPIYWVDQSDDDVERMLGVPATLSPSVVVAPGPPPPPDAFEITVTSLTKTLDEPVFVAQVTMTENL